MTPGAMAFTRTLSAASSAASTLVIWKSAALETPYAASPGNGLKPAIDDTNRMLPPLQTRTRQTCVASGVEWSGVASRAYGANPAFTMCGATSWVKSRPPVTFVCRIYSVQCICARHSAREPLCLLFIWLINNRKTIRTFSQTFSSVYAGNIECCDIQVCNIDKFTTEYSVLNSLLM